MAMSPENYYKPPTPKELGKFVNDKVIPPIDPSRLDVGLLYGERRAKLHTPITGDMSLVLSYKNKEGYLASLGDEGEALSILQFQGASRREGYRVTSGLHLIRLFASQIHKIADHPESPYRELYMPPVFTIEGLEVAVSSMAAARYESLATELGMQFSHEELRFVMKVK